MTKSYHAGVTLVKSSAMGRKRAKNSAAKELKNLGTIGISHQWNQEMATALVSIDLDLSILSNAA
ncbi:hypothetical protein IQ235_07350 [Oscillatoriales cyanobacterium LEGE 11467]|uniref:Uncharacterized protein n=1 Tax=Zarconia navalis LEGE 11467 TaxID=1828826 RepID=A0A928Z8F0_9CYAN|nr:hypothetical protein [Zarconia navalis]MBE9040598.1 hypothetical protein [Zarconia navalis LEGE 11467]